MTRYFFVVMWVLYSPVSIAQTDSTESEKSSLFDQVIQGADDLIKVTEGLAEKAVELTKAAVVYTTDQLSELVTDIEAELNALEKPESVSKIDVKEKIYQLRLAVDDLVELKEKEEEAPKFSLLSKSKKDYKVEMDKLLQELEPILFDGEVLNYAGKIRNAQNKIKDLRLEIAVLSEEKLFANPEKSGDYKKKIDNRKGAIKSLEKLIEKLEFDLMKKFHRLGVDMSISQVKVLTRRADGDELAHTLAVFDVTKQLSSKLGELMVSTEYEPEFTKKYYGIYVVMAEMVLYSQRVYVSRIKEIYLPAIDTIENDIKNAIKFAKESIKKQDNEDNKNILRRNIETNKFSLEVVDFYRNILIEQEKSLRKAMKNAINNVDVAYSTYDTAAISSNLISLIDTTQYEFDKVLNMQIPNIIPFDNKALEDRFIEISERIAISSG